MKMNNMFSRRPLFILCLATTALFSSPICAQDSFNRSGQYAVAQAEAPVRYGSGGFAPTDLSGNTSSKDDMTGGVVASPTSPPTSNSYQANIEERLSTIETQMREMRGQLEEKDHQITQLKTQLDKALADIDMRLNQGAAPAVATTPSSSGNLQSNDMSGGMPPQPAVNADPNAPASASSSTVKPLGEMKQAPGGASIPPSSNDPAAQYDVAFTKLKNGDYGSAQGDFARFLKANPTHQLAGNATYWYGETFYAQQKFTDAARIFAESYKKFPQGTKAPDSLLKLGLSLGGAGKTKESCVALRQLKKQYPSAAGTVLKRADQEMAKLACP